jgi:hypothetical protein
VPGPLMCTRSVFFIRSESAFMPGVMRA